MARSVVGIDIGSRSVRAVEVGDSVKAKPTVLRYFEVPLPEGAVSSGEVLEPNTVAAALRQLWSEGRFKSRKVVLGIGNQRVLARDLTVPKTTLARIRQSLPFEVQDMLPVPVAEAVLDFYPIEETVGEHGPMVRGLLLAAVKESVLANVNAIRLAGLTAIDVDLIPFALSRVLLSRPDVSGTVALVDIGGSTTSVLIATDGVPQFVRIIATGGDDVTQSLREGLGSQGEDPEVMKRRLGLATGSVAPSDKMAVEIIYKVASEQLSILRNTINYFVNTRPIEAVSSIILTGGGAQMEGLPTALADQTRLSVVVGDPFVSVTLGSGVDEADIRRRSSALTVALGLALWRAS